MNRVKPLIFASGAIMFVAIVTILLLPLFNKEVDDQIVVHIEVPEVEAVLPQMTEYYSTPTIMRTQEDFQSFYASTSVGVVQEFQSTARASSLSVTVDEANAYLYDIANSYFICYYGMQRVSPIFPMALSNVETPGRADNNKTWCALIPTRYVDVSRALEFNVLNVYDSTEIQKALTTEYSTRDRGCLQMSPTYGAQNSYFNSLMSGTEKEKLSGKTDSWASGASTYSGDRFYLPDVLLRLSAAMQGQLDSMAKNGYIPETDAQLVCMLAISHQSSGVWSMSNHSTKIGCWYSADKAQEWCSKVADEGFVQVLTDYARSHNNTYIDSSVAGKLWNSYYGDTSGYATTTLVLYYPIKVLYSYIKLTLLYTGG